MRNLWVALITLSLVVIVSTLRRRRSYFEGYDVPTKLTRETSVPLLEPPYRNVLPVLNAPTQPVDMLLDKKGLIMNGYRFQRANKAPIAFNAQCVNHDFPAVFEQRVGRFNPTAMVEYFTDLGASQATMSQLVARGAEDKYLLGQPGDPIEDNYDNTNIMGKYSGFAPNAVWQRVGYRNSPFSWGDIIHRFYGTHPDLAYIPINAKTPAQLKAILEDL
jgi:hypothetical protein